MYCNAHRPTGLQPVGSWQGLASLAVNHSPTGQGLVLQQCSLLSVHYSRARRPTGLRPVGSRRGPTWLFSTLTFRHHCQEKKISPEHYLPGKASSFCGDLDGAGSSRSPQHPCGDLKHPPPTYLEPAIDIWASLDLILSNIRTGKYANEYAFQTDLFKTMNRVHDGHFQFVPDLLSKALSFQRPFKLVSVSMDGVNVPKVYSLGRSKLFTDG
jgi:hypothetical protein